LFRKLRERIILADRDGSSESFLEELDELIEAIEAELLKPSHDKNWLQLLARIAWWLFVLFPPSD